MVVKKGPLVFLTFFTFVLYPTLVVTLSILYLHYASHPTQWKTRLAHSGPASSLRIAFWLFYVTVKVSKQFISTPFDLSTHKQLGNPYGKLRSNPTLQYFVRQHLSVCCSVFAYTITPHICFPFCQYGYFFCYFFISFSTRQVCATSPNVTSKNVSSSYCKTRLSESLSSLSSSVLSSFTWLCRCLQLSSVDSATLSVLVITALPSFYET